MVARLERDKALDRCAGRVVTDSPNDSDKSAAIEQFRRLTAEEIQAALKDIRYSARVQVASAISRETFILHRKLATVLDRTQDMNIKKLLKALHQRYLCLDVKELGEDAKFVSELIERTNEYLATTKLGIKIHLRNGFVLLGPEKGYEAVHVVDNEETRKTMHYTGAKIAKPVPVSAPAQAKDSLKAGEEATSEEAGLFLKRIKENEKRLRKEE